MEETKVEKPGYKTTEFWLTLISSLGMFITNKFGVAIPMEIVMGIAGIVITYVLGRSVVKQKKNE